MISFFFCIQIDKVVWKRTVGDREICDVCRTTLFNFHWTCRECGFACCIDCYNEHKSNENIPKWLLCTNEKVHTQRHLVLTQIIAGDALKIFSKQIETVQIRLKTKKDDNADKSNQNNTTESNEWFCHGKLLRLLDPNDANNLQLFQKQWKKKQPVLVSNVDKNLDDKLWRPETFANDFADHVNDLQNCLTNEIFRNVSLKCFWNGFADLNERLKDENGTPLILKLKDWPSYADFATILPTRFTNLMNALPLGEYTKRNGIYNLANRLPNHILKPDLGPKMYSAYGSALHPTKATTNLHLDVSDAVNIMVYADVPQNAANNDAYVNDAIDNSGCDQYQKERLAREQKNIGAIWHIYDSCDANKIRQLLNKVAIERGEKNFDSIHDQSWYLDSVLRNRLKNDYGVVGYTIIQCIGDAVFIPAGAPHQVQNLSDCIKVAIDFVSPENVSKCYELTQEFRRLPETHVNHEDKLQIKNIIYFAVTDTLEALSMKRSQRIRKKKYPKE